MATAKITLMGMYHWDEDLFHDMIMPDGINKDQVIQNILLRGAEFEVLYADPDFMKQAIAVWSNKWYRTFAEWLRGTQATWNPIHNYDRIEDIRDEGRKKFDEKTTADYTDSRTANLQDKRTANLQDETTFLNDDTTSQTVNGTTQHDVSAYDSSGYSPSSKDTINNGTSKVSHTGTVTVKNTGTDTMNTTGTDKNNRKGTLEDKGGSEQNTNIHTAHIYGNIGVTQSSDMLRSFYDISTWNLMDHISDVFVGELLIPVY